MSFLPKGPELTGGVVRRSFNMGERRMLAGQHLSAEELRAMPTGNRNALIENRFIEVARDLGPADDRPRERVVMELPGTTAAKRFYVVEGVRINKKLMSADEAQTLATASPNN